MSITLDDIATEAHNFNNSSTGTGQPPVYELVIEENQLATYAGQPSVTLKVIEGRPPLKFGKNLRAFKEMFTEQQLEDARKRVAKEEIGLGAKMTLARLRMSKGISQAELADRIGKTQANMSYIERGRTDPSGSTIRRLSKTLNVSADDILDAIEVAGKTNG